MQLSFHEGVGDHRTTLVDITARSLLGIDGFRIVRPQARRLTCSNKKSIDRFVKYVEQELERHKLHDRLSAASRSLYFNSSDSEAIKTMETIDLQMEEIFLAGEKQCRKITDRPLPFSAPVAYWVHRKWAYQGLLRIAEGRCNNIGNAKRRARKAGIDGFNLSKQQAPTASKSAPTTYDSSDPRLRAYGGSIFETA